MKIILTRNEWTRKQVENTPLLNYLFGDNLQKVGQAGQACIRGLPNAYGIPTKVLPSMKIGAFFTDDTYQDNCTLIQYAYSLIPNDKPLVVNINIGKGLAELDRRAPKTYKFLCELLGIEL